MTTIEVKSQIQSDKERKKVEALINNKDWESFAQYNVPSRILKELAEDKKMQVRLAVAKHKNTPIEVLEILTKDKEELVRKVAIKHKNTLEEKMIKEIAKEIKMVKKDLEDLLRTMKAHL